MPIGRGGRCPCSDLVPIIQEPPVLVAEEIDRATLGDCNQPRAGAVWDVLFRPLVADVDTRVLRQVLGQHRGFQQGIR